MNRKINVTIIDCLYSKEYEHVYAVVYYMKYKYLYITYENGSSRMISNVEEFVTDSDVACNVITD